MKLIVKPNYTEAFPASHEEHEKLKGILLFLDPRASSSYTFWSGAWNGMVNYFLNKECTKFPSGFIPLVKSTLEDYGYDVSIDERIPPVPQSRVALADLATKALPGVVLRDYQVRAVQAALEKRTGVVKAPPRSGKTYIQAAMASILDCRSVILVQSRALMDQHYATLQSLGLDVGRYGGGKKDLRRQHTVAMFQSVYHAYQKKDKELLRFLREVELAQVDEVHHLSSAETYFRVFGEIEAPYRLGYSGTPFRVARSKGFDADDFRLMGITGQLIFEISSTVLREAGFLVETEVHMYDVRGNVTHASGDWHEIYKSGITENKERNKLISNIVGNLYQSGECVLTLVTHLSHGYEVLKQLTELGIPTLMVQGDNKVTMYRGGVKTVPNNSNQVRAAIENRKLRSVVATSVYDEGIDLPSLDTVVIAGGGKSSIKTIQKAYRSQTKHGEKKTAKVIDFVDHFSRPLFKHSQQRQKDYTEEGLTIIQHKA